MLWFWSGFWWSRDVAPRILCIYNVDISITLLFAYICLGRQIDRQTDTLFFMWRDRRVGASEKSHRKKNHWKYKFRKCQQHDNADKLSGSGARGHIRNSFPVQIHILMVWHEWVGVWMHTKPLWMRYSSLSSSSSYNSWAGGLRTRMSVSRHVGVGLVEITMQCIALQWLGCRSGPTGRWQGQRYRF